MKRIALALVILITIIIGGGIYWFKNKTNATIANPNTLINLTNDLNVAGISTSTPLSQVTFINLGVPFTPEAPDGLMVKPWNNSCEEASIVMLDEFYFGNNSTRIPKESAKKKILAYIGIENKIFGYNANTNAKEMVKLINSHSKYFEATQVTNPTLEDIKLQLKEGKPVIALLYGYKLKNPRIRFAVNGSYYHTFVIKGFDDNKKEFIVNDNGDLNNGLDLRYSYDTIMGALADYSHKLGKTIQPPTVLFTRQRILAKSAGSNRVYLIMDNERHHITSPAVFKDNGWKWSSVTTVSKDWLRKYNEGYPI